MNKNKALFNLFHIICWVCVFVPTVLLVPRYDKDDVEIYCLRIVLPTTMCLMFYINYLWLAPKYHLKENKQKTKFRLLNLFFLILFVFISHVSFSIIHDREVLMGYTPKETTKAISFLQIPLAIIQLTMAIGISGVLATLLRHSLSIQIQEKTNRESKIKRVEAQLSSLQLQTSPHFLLNTLNNIYALVELDPRKAKKAIQELSQLLRKMLYGTQDTYIPLTEVTSFLTDYTELMKLRLQENVKVELNIDIPTPCSYKVAPFIFLSLVENAFKHGVSATEDSFIKINISANDERIECFIQNTNHPKSQDDHSGHGIGLQNVQNRLDMCYPGKYTWTKEIDKNNIYSSKITLYETKLRNY